MEAAGSPWPCHHLCCPTWELSTPVSTTGGLVLVKDREKVQDRPVEEWWPEQ